MAEDKCTGTRSTSKNKVDAQLAFFLRGGGSEGILRRKSVRRRIFLGKRMSRDFVWGGIIPGRIYTGEISQGQKSRKGNCPGGCPDPHTRVNPFTTCRLHVA